MNKELCIIFTQRFLERLASNFITKPKMEIAQDSFDDKYPISVVQGCDNNGFHHEFTLHPGSNAIKHSLRYKHGSYTNYRFWVEFGMDGSCLIRKRESSLYPLRDSSEVEDVFRSVEVFIREVISELKNDFYSEKVEVEL